MAGSLGPLPGAAGLDFTPWPPERAALYRRLGYWQGQSFAAWLRERASHFGPQPALLTEDGQWAYADLLQLSAERAREFLALGLRPGDHALLHLPNHPEFFFSLFGLLLAGVRPVLCLPAHRWYELRAFAQQAGVQLYVGPDDAAGQGLGQALQEHWPDMRVSLRPLSSQSPSLQPSAAGDVPQLPGDSADPQQPAFYQLSGGSTGTPKLIPRTHDDYLYSVRASAAICELSPGTVYLAALPLAHNFALSSPGTLGVLHAGGRVVVAPQPDPATCFRLAERFGANFTALVPALLLLWLDAATRRGAPASLNTVQVGGAPLPAAVAARVPTALEARLQQVFGMAEGLVNYTPLRGEVLLESQGFAISPHDEIRIWDDHDRPVPDGTPGHLLTRGPYTICGYFRAAEYNARAFTADGFFRTGDIVTRLPDGSLRVTGRSKDQINRAGEKVAAEEIEHALLGHRAVHNAALIGVHDAWLGERSVACIQPEAGQPAPPAAELRAYLLNLGLAAYKLPDHFEYLKLPRTPAGKIDKRALRALFQENA